MIFLPLSLDRSLPHDGEKPIAARRSRRQMIAATLSQINVFSTGKDDRAVVQTGKQIEKVTPKSGLDGE
jgi:hypothetical protein